MENQDKVYEHFQQAAQKAESKDFPAMDKVWARVEDKLDKKALKNENSTLKKIAIAASFLLLMTLGYQFLNKEETIEVIPNNSIVSPAKEEKIIPIDSAKKDAVVISDEKHPLIKENADKIIQEQLDKQESLALEEVNITYDDLEEPENNVVSKKLNKNKEESNFTTRKFNSMSVKRSSMEPRNLVQKEEDALTVQEKSNPLVVLDGKAMKDSSAKGYLNGNSDDFETITYLPNPLYIINGVEYTEQELFGPNPTSPYYPLAKQEILSTSILQGESATNLYGEKGKQGVVIITTKNGKPLKK